MSAEPGEFARGEPAGGTRAAGRAVLAEGERVGARGARRRAQRGGGAHLGEDDRRLDRVHDEVLAAAPLLPGVGGRCDRQRALDQLLVLAQVAGRAVEHPLVVLAQVGQRVVRRLRLQDRGEPPAGIQGGSADDVLGAATRRRAQGPRRPGGREVGGAGDADADEERRAREGSHPVGAGEALSRTVAGCGEMLVSCVPAL